MELLQTQIINDNDVIKNQSPFIEANTKSVSLEHLKNDCIIPNFSKDNETTISHYQFINKTMEVTQAMFPDIRYGAELHKSLPLSLEASFGFRALKYSSTTTIYTGSVGWYTGNDYWSFRVYVTPGEPGASKSGTLSYRKYRRDANNYLSIEAGMGFSPDIYRFDFEGNENTIIDLQSQKFKLGYYFTSKSNKSAWGIQAGVSHQEISFDPGSYFWIYSVGLSWDVKFR